MIRYCLPVMERSEERVLAAINTYQDQYDFFEIYIDYLDKKHFETVEQVSFILGDRAIFVLRRHDDTPVKLHWEIRSAILTCISESNSYVDLDIYKQRKEIEFIKKEEMETSLILSYHNYEETPDDVKLALVVKDMNAYNGSVCKISTYCQSRRDALRLLSFGLELSEAGERYIVLGMGEYGMITRLFGTLWGNELAYAPVVLENSSAPGQMTIEDLSRCVEILDLCRNRVEKNS